MHLFRYRLVAALAASTLLGLLIAPGPAAAQISVVVPNANATTEGNASDVGPFVQNSQTYQLIISASQLNSLPVGSLIGAIAFRQDVTEETGPPNELTFERYDIFLGQAAAGVTPSSFSTTFANNFAGGNAGRTQVRSGLLVVEQNSFPGDPNGPGPNPFGPDIVFNMAQYAYQGGDLVLEIRQAGNTFVFSDLDAVTNNADIAGLAAASDDATMTEFTGVNAVVTRFTTVPEPGTVALVAAGVMPLLGAAARRRQRKR